MKLLDGSLLACCGIVVGACGTLGCGEDSAATLVERGALRVALPEPGMRVWSELLWQDGRAETLDVLVDDDGQPHVAYQAIGSPEDAVDSVATSASPSQCTDGAYALLGTGWDQPLSWWFKASSTPTELDVGATEAALQKATDNILRGRNSCSLSDQIDAGAHYLGRTSTTTQVRTDGGCNAGDGKNVVNFGDLPGGVLGVTCTWSGADGVSLESDIKLNKGDFFWTTAPTSSACNDAFDVESVVTHERGHSFGVGHVSEAGHANLTMSTAINGACQRAEVTLGRGDVMALRALY